MAALGQEIFAGIADLHRTYAHRSSVPFVLEDQAPDGCLWEFDYEYEYESPEDMPMVSVTAVRFVAHDGTEYPIRVGTLDGRWIASVESLIAEELAFDAEAAAEALR